MLTTQKQRVSLGGQHLQAISGKMFGEGSARETWALMIKMCGGGWEGGRGMVIERTGTKLSELIRSRGVAEAQQK